MAKDYSKLEKDDLLKVIEKLESRKKYGLIWDEEKTKEKFEKESENALPVLKEVKGKEIKTDPAKPTNILIEGDNYHALSVLNYTHQGEIDVIYIDPPYNTGREKEWKFNDKWIDKNDSYRHSKWLSFVSKRLRLAKQLLKEEGVILISIDDNEYAQLKLFCDNLFGEKQFIGSLVWEKKKKGSHLDVAITNVKEYILAYSKNADFFGGLIGEVNEDKETYPCLNPGNGYSARTIPFGTKSTYRQGDVSLPKGHIISAGNMKLTLLSNLNIKNKRLKDDVTIKAEWRYDQNSINEFAQKDELYFTQDLYLRRIVAAPRYKKLKDLLLRTSNAALEEHLRELIELYQDEDPDKEKIKSLLKKIQSLEESDYNTEINPNNLYMDGWGSNEDGDNEQRDIFGKKVFDYPKPSRLIEKLIAATGISAGIVLDFFAGSGTTAHAVMKLNKKGKNIQYILCTNNEDNDGSGLKIATDICYPRVKKVIEGFIDRNKNKVEELGGNLKYFKTAFVKTSISRDDLKIRITRECTEMLCLRESIFDEAKATNADYRIFEQNGRVMGIYYALERDGLKQLKKELDKMKGEKLLYCFTLDPLGLDKADFEEWENVSLEPIPQKILDIYEQIYEY
jgi:adenine-specific DNA-methyltransferase